MAERPQDRRQFLTQSAGSVGALALGAPGLALATAGNVNDQLNLGVVGLGSRGGSLLQWAQRLAPAHNLRITALCDLWEKRRVQSAERVEQQTGRRPALCRTIGELCDRSDVDAVLIATCDFQHCYHAALAVAAGKDVYVEKPFGCDFEQVQRAAATIRQSDRILQFGVQSRGARRLHDAAQFVQTGGLGQVTYVEISEPIFQQRWRVPGAELAPTSPEIDWSEFLCYLPSDTPFSSRHYREFRLFWPFSTGPFCQWMSHRIDAVNFVLGKLPVSAAALGGVFLWKDGRTNPDTVQVLFNYPQGVLVSYHLRMGNSANGRGTTFYGSRGTLELESGLAFGNGGGGLVCQTGQTNGVPNFSVDRSKVLRAKNEGGMKLGEEEDLDYLAHFIDCCRSRRQPVGGIDAAYGQAVASILAHQAYTRQCTMSYDADRQTILPAQTGVIA